MRLIEYERGRNDGTPGSYIIPPQPSEQPFHVTPEQGEVVRELATKFYRDGSTRPFPGGNIQVDPWSKKESEGAQEIRLNYPDDADMGLFWKSLDVRLQERGDTAINTANALRERSLTTRSRGTLSGLAAGYFEFRDEHIAFSIGLGVFAALNYLTAFSLSRLSKRYEKKALGLNPNTKPIKRLFHQTPEPSLIPTRK